MQKWKVRLEVGNYCNLKCPLCVREIVDKKILNTIHLSLDTVKKFLPRTFLRYYVSDVYLSGAVAEPTLNPDFIDIAVESAQECDICIVVGTSMQVAPANQIPFLTKPNTLIYYVDPSDINFHIDKQRKPFFEHIKDVASIGMEKIKNDLRDAFN